MTTPGAAQRQLEDDPEPTPAGLCAKTDKALEDLRALMGRLAARQADRTLLVELMNTGLHLEEVRGELARFAELTAMRDVFIDLGREIERQEQARMAIIPRTHRRHARPSRLRVVGTTVATSGVAAGLITGTYAVQQDSASVHHFAGASPAAVMSIAPPDVATLIPQGSPVRSSSSPRPSVNAKSAAPVVTPSPSAPVVTASPPQPAPVATQVAPPALEVSTGDLQLSGTTGTFTLAATTTEGVPWSIDVSGIPGATVDVVQGILTSAQQPVTITLTDPLMESGVIYIKWGTQGISTIWVTPSVP